MVFKHLLKINEYTRKIYWDVLFTVHAEEENSFYVRTGVQWRDRMPLIIRPALPTCNKFIDLTCKTSAVQVGTMSITSTS